MHKRTWKVISILLVITGIIVVGWNWMAYFSFQSAEKDIPKVEAKAPEKKKETNGVQPLYDKAPKIGETIGTLFIPKIDATLPIVHGTDEDELEKGVGHYANSVLPGERDNSVLSGHRDTVFRKLGEVEEGDILVVTTSAGEFTYKVTETRIVDKDDRTVIVPSRKPILTVTTCYPFNFIGDAPDRFIVQGNLIQSET
ncbi:class D sortase [Radiobacillus kanasensis]|uniref:class D sortase n=1 Tax=Radiobacillus kanasensis TaxID=2844358 RepID=UPI001E45B371|nr:class D sortase [Radiobacillus kanasensis]UFT99723.1 class D sortase [Radiobacillus kanasensis]